MHDDVNESMSTRLLQEAPFFTWVNSRFVKWFTVFDAKTLRPIFVRKSKESHVDKEDVELTFYGNKDLDKPLLNNS